MSTPPTVSRVALPASAVRRGSTTFRRWRGWKPSPRWAASTTDALDRAARLVDAELQRDVLDAGRRCHRRATGNGGEAFVDAEDIAAVVAATLADPEGHAGAEYAPTGPDVLTVSEAADIIGSVTGRPVRHVDIDRLPWLDSVIASGVPAEYGEMLQILTETIASGRRSRPNGDVEKVTGAPPRSFTDFARRTGAAWTGDVAP